MLMQDPSMWKRHLLRPQLWSFFGPEVTEMNLDRDRVKAYIGRVDLFFEFWSLSFVSETCVENLGQVLKELKSTPRLF